VKLSSEQWEAIDALLARRAQLVLGLSPIFVAFNAVDWAVYPEHAGDWLLLRLGLFTGVLGLHLGIARRRERSGFPLAVVYAIAFSLPITIMTYRSGGFDSRSY